MKFAIKPARHYPPHFRHVATLPLEIKIYSFLEIFSRYRRKCKQICIFFHISPNFNSSTRVTDYAECMCMLTELLKYLYKGLVIFLDKMWVSLKRAGCYVVMFGGSVSRNFFNSLLSLNTLCSTFLRKFVCQPLCCVRYPFKYKIFIKILSSLTNTAVTSAVMNFQFYLQISMGKYSLLTCLIFR